MCNDPKNCGRFTTRDISKQFIFSHPSTLKKLKAANDLPAPIEVDLNGTTCLKWCGTHLEYIAAKEAEHLTRSRRYVRGR